MKKIILASYLLAATAVSTSCSDFLDVKPTHAADATSSINTASDALVVIRGLMSNLASGSYLGRNFQLYGDVKGGDFTIVSQGRGYDYLYVFNHSTNTNNYSSVWTQGYYCIAQINNLLEQIEKIKANGSTENFDSYIGQALTARAMIYFDLVRMYGEPYNENKEALGVPITVNSLEYTAKPGRNSVEETYQQVLKDLKDAETLLPKAKSNGFINFYANKALQARVYLYQEDFNNALLAAEEVITPNVYSLYPNTGITNWIDSWGTEFGTESIFELAILPSEGDLGNSSLGAYYRRRGHPNTTIALGYFTASTNFINLLNQDPNDVRKGIMSYDETSNTRLGSLYKYSGSTDVSTTTGKGDGKGNTTAVNIKVIRLSEVYLIAAEAALRKSSPDLTKASNYLNQIRKRSPNLAASTDATINLDMIVDERSKELIGEGHRFFDMMRWNKSITFDDGLGSISTIHRTATIDRSFFKTILPIPLAEINANSVIKEQQNAGYNN
jgi:tetratricopeptide (TPR) repeat protein